MIFKSIHHLFCFYREYEEVSEEKVRSYLSKKRMSKKELIDKFEKKTRLPSEQLELLIASILKKINPKKKTVNHIMYYSIENSL